MSALVRGREVVYLAHNPLNGRVKIGFTAGDPTVRLSSLSTGAGCRLQLLRVLPGSQPTEKWMHRRFADLRCFGEWFTYHDDMLTVIPPDEIIKPVSVTIRRDVRLTLKERLRDAISNADEVGLSAQQTLLVFITSLQEDEAAAFLSMASAVQVADAELSGIAA